MYLKTLLEEMMETDTANAFVEESRIIHDKCKNCNGKDLQKRMQRNRDPNTHENSDCDAYYNFLSMHMTKWTR